MERITRKKKSSFFSGDFLFGLQPEERKQPSSTPKVPPKIPPLSKLNPPSSKWKKKIESKGKYGAQLWTWFLALSPEERGRVLSFEDKDGVTLVRQMYSTKAKEGDGLFFSVDDPVLVKLKEKSKSIKFDSNFCFKKFTSLSNLCFYPERLIISDNKLEDNIRVCDTREYLDTFTVSSTLIEDGEQFLNLMDIVTRGNFLTVPCKVVWDPNSRSWSWESPKWFRDMGYYSLGTYIAHKLEKVLWMRYWDSHQLDPRVKPGGLNYVFPNYLEGLLSKAYLIDFWSSRTPQERRKIVGNFGNLVLHVLLNTDESDRVHQMKKSEYPQLLSTLVDLSTEERNLEVLFHDSDIRQNEKTFIEILYFSPMSRAGLAIDKILRRIGMSIHSAYTEKLCMDLIIGEEAEKIKKASTAEHKKKKRKKKKNKVREKKKELIEKEQREKEQKEREDKEKKQLQEMKRKQAEIKKGVTSLVMDIISQTEAIIDKKKRLLSPTSKRKAKKKKKKGDGGHNHREKHAENSESFLGKENFVSERRSNSLSAISHDTPHCDGRKSLSSSCEYLPEPRVAIRQSRSVTRVESHKRAQMQILTQEIEDFMTYTKSLLAKVYLPHAEAMIKKIRLVVASAWPSAKVEVYGSYATSLCIPSSDLDLVVIGAYNTINNTCSSESPIRTLSNLLNKQSKWVSSLQTIETAKVPVIKFITNQEKISTDISFEERSCDAPMYYCPGSNLPVRHAGLAACEVVKGFIRTMPALTPLVLILKQFLYERGLNNAYTGGLSSYCVVLMVVSYLQLFGSASKLLDSNGTTTSRLLKRKKNLGSLLVEFLDLYGKRFDFQTTGISVTNGGSHFDLKTTPYKFPPAPLVIVDPLNPTNNIGQSCYGIVYVKSAFEEAHSKISAPFYNDFTPATLLSRIISRCSPSSSTSRSEHASPEMPKKQRTNSLSAPSPSASNSSSTRSHSASPPSSSTRKHSQQTTSSNGVQ